MTTKILPGATGVLALADGTILQGVGVGAVGSVGLVTASAQTSTSASSAGSSGPS